jgi:hypothetical protein
MKFFRLDLLTLLISLFILNSCKNQDNVGLGIIAPSQVGGILVDTSSIIVNTVLEDSVLTSVDPTTNGSLAKNPLGYFNDPIFGTTTSNLATDLNLPNSAGYSLPSGTISIDSARLVLKYADGFYGDSSSSSYTVNVFPLNEKYKSSVAYYNTKQWDVNTNNLVGSLTFNAKPHAPVKITSIITGGPDSTITVAPQIRIPISPSYINQILFSANSTTLGSNAIFQNSVKGLFITLDKAKTKGTGGTFMIKPADSIYVYYKAVKSDGTIDTNQVILPINNYAAQISQAYSQEIKTELSASASAGSRNKFYLQGAGLRTKISFPNLLTNIRNDLMKRDSDIVLNRAEVVITPYPQSHPQFAPPLAKMSMYRLDIAHQRTLIQDASLVDPRSGGVAIFGGFYSPTQDEYHFIITAYLQDLLLKRTVDYGTYIGAIDTTNKTRVDIAATSQVAARTVATGTDKSGSRIKLNIIYTKISKK